MIVTLLEDPAGAEIPAKRIIDQLSLPIYHQDKELKIGGSIGISVFPTDADDVGNLIESADKALYAAKEAGRNTFRFVHKKNSRTEKKKAAGARR